MGQPLHKLVSAPSKQIFKNKLPGSLYCPIGNLYLQKKLLSPLRSFNTEKLYATSTVTPVIFPFMYPTKL